MSGGITTHVLDTSRGTPVAGVPVIRSSAAKTAPGSSAGAARPTTTGGSKTF